MIHFPRSPILRGIALGVALSIVATGSGLPMCLSRLAQTAAPCDMHSVTHGRSTHMHAAQLAALAPQVPGQACHPDAAGLGCAAGSACPTAGPAAPAWIKVPVALRTASRMGVLGPVSALASYLAPPLSPPPQA